MRLRSMLAAFFVPLLLGSAVQAQGFRSTSLDQNIIALKEARSLAALCVRDPQIRECRYAIGEWKPE